MKRKTVPTRAIVIAFLIVLALGLAAFAPLLAAENSEPAGGWRALRERRYADAMKEADNVLSKKPKDIGAHWLAAEAALAQKDTTTSLNHWYAVLDTDPIHPQALINVVELLIAKADTVRARKILDITKEKRPDVAELDASTAAKSSYSRLASSARSTASKVKPDFAAFAYCQGLMFQAGKNDAEAMVKFSQAIDYNPQEPHFYAALARVYKEKKVFALAEQNFQEALSIDSTSAGVHYELALVQMELREYSEALAHFKTARDIDPDFPNVNYQIGRLYFYAEKYEQAAQELQAALQKAKESNFFLLSIYGQTLRAINRLPEAQEYLEKAYALKPTDLSTARALAINSVELRKFDRAVDVLKSIIVPPQVEPSDYALLGESYYNMAGKGAGAQAFYDSAAVYLKKGYDLNPGNSRLAYLLGMTYFGADQYDSALVYFDKRVQADPTSSATYFYLGYCYLKKEMYQESIANLRRSSQLDSTRASVHTMLGQTLTLVDSTRAAKQEFHTAIELDSTQSDAYGGLGFVFLREENWSGAAASLKRATELQPANRDYWLAYGQAAYYLEDYGTAERAFRRVLQYDPNNKDARTGLDTIEKVKSRKKK